MAVFGQARTGENAGPNASEKGGVTGLPGQLDFQADLFAGRFSYQVPFPLAPGRHDSAPNLALSYNSANANGWCGVGWDLDLGYIQRETRHGVPVKWNNGGPVAAYDDSKGFIFSLNGQMSSLVNVTNTEYRAEIQGSFLRFSFLTNNNQWLVTDKSGNQYFFGTNSAARMSNSKAGWQSNAWSGTYRWSLSHVQTVLGDTIDYAYTNIGGTLYPLKLSYNGHTSGLSNTHTVDFGLETRTDVPLNFISGYRVETSRRINSLVHKVSGQVVWSNRLIYAQSSSTSRSLLQSVTRYGTNLTSSLPPIALSYSVQQFGFQSLVNWTNVPVPGSDTSYNSPIVQNAADLVDMDGDGLPDRVYVTNNFPYTNIWVCRNNGGGFDNPVPFGRLSVQTYPGDSCITSQTSSNNLSWDGLNVSAGYTRFMDINGDGYPDRVCDPIESLSSITCVPTNYTRLLVQYNNSTNFVSGTDAVWTNVIWNITQPGDPGPTYHEAIENGSTVMMIDMNGDGLPDRVMARGYGSGLGGGNNGTWTNYFVQFNTGNGFTTTNYFMFPFYDSTSQPGLYGAYVNSSYVRMIDMNGDGLPDRVMYAINPVLGVPDGTCSDNFNTNYVEEFNNGYSFEPPVLWQGVVEKFTDACTGGTVCPEYQNGLSLQDTESFALRDINGDGLPDRIYRITCYNTSTNWMVQINQGTNFGVPQLYGPYYSQNQVTDMGYMGIEGGGARLIDINGDGIPDHVMPPYPLATSTTYFGVELSKGPFPDLLTVVSNGIGGSVNVAYNPSTKYDNREATNSVNARKILPFPVYTVSSVSISDGIYPGNTTTYAYQGGKWNTARREFDGFAITTQVDPLSLTNIHWFHQAGGRDNSTFGEYQDTTNTLGKRGMEFRTDIYGSDGKPYKLTLNKVDEAALAGGQHFAFVSQTMSVDYPGSTAAYRATAQQFAYDLSNGNLTNSTDYGEVTNVMASSQSFTDVTGDSTYQFITFASLSNTNILDKPSHKTLTSDNAGADILRETLLGYDGNTGDLTQQRDRMCPTCYITNSYGYDSYNNRNSATDEAGIVTTITYDSTYQTFPVQQIQSGTFTSTLSYDARSGKLLSSTDPKGLVTANSYDAFFRPTETDVSTTPNGSPSQWLARYDYRLGMAGGTSTNSVRLRKADGVDASNGHESWTYSDGLGRVIQVREESETNNSFRVTDTIYDKRGSLKFVTLPYFGTGTNFVKPTGTEMGMLRVYDSAGRMTNITTAVNGSFTSGQLTTTTATGGDNGSPVGSSSIAYANGNDPWTLVSTDEAGKVHRYVLDAYGRTNQIVEVTSGGNYTTLLAYNLAGDLTNVTDNANNQIQYAYNDLGQVVAMADPDMGVWQYQRDFAGRVRKQIDADGNMVVFNYDDALGRLHSRQIFDYTGTNTYNVTNVYDSSDDANFTAYAGQLYKVIDKEGYTKNSYDVRGRTLKVARYLVKNGNTYTNQFAFDDADRVTQTVYPNGGPIITNIFDFGGNLSQVKQVGGSNWVFYTAIGFNALGQLLGINFGNSVVTTNNYFANSKRLQRVVTFKTGSTNIQDLSYTYDAASNLKSIGDGVYTTNASAALTNLVYDDLHRLTSLTRPALSQTITFGYDSIGNITTNGEFGTGAYNYGSRLPHAVKSANGTNYAYDMNGNMLVRGNQRLSYDAENRLAYVVTASAYSTFGYDAGGARLWKLSSGTNTLQVWIDGNYEEKNGQTLFHVNAGSQTVCTFDTTGTNVFAYYHPDNLRSTAIETDQNGNRIQHYEYKAFGQDRFTESSTAFPVSKRYTSQIKDEETGLYYYNARYYDAQVGRFVQPDSIIPHVFDPQSLNRYTYVYNNPLKNTDPSGHSSQSELDEAARRLGEMTGKDWGNYAQAAHDFGIRGYEIQTAGNIAGISDVAHKTGNIADAYVNLVPNIAEMGVGLAVSAGAREVVEHAPGMTVKLFSGGVKNFTKELEVSANVARAHLREALGAGEGQAHHIIPWELRNNELMKRAAEGGFNINGAENGIRLGQDIHYGSHAKYNAAVESKLNSILKSNPNLSPQEAAKGVQGFANQLRAGLQRTENKLK
jgi:RHS repeat-associated protein